MRSSKSRSRSKQNRNRSVGNIINRVFDSSGPEGKVRGTPQQIIDKYNQLARDAQLSNDRVAAENFQQHSEHYTRMLSEAMREMETQRQGQGGYSDGPSNGNGNGGQNGNGQNANNQNAGNQYAGNQNATATRTATTRTAIRTRAATTRVATTRTAITRAATRQSRESRPRDDRDDRDQPQPERSEPPVRAERHERDSDELPAFVTQPAARQPVVSEDAFALDATDDQADSGLVETPESAPKPKATRARRPRTPPVGADGQPSEVAK